MAEPRMNPDADRGMPPHLIALAVLLLAGCSVIVTATQVLASGPEDPRGWGTPRHLGSRQSCCIPADLNGSGLVGGAFLEESTDGKRYAVFALMYSRHGKEVWQRLESGPALVLPNISMTFLGSHTLNDPTASFGGIVVCDIGREGSTCRLYWLAKGATKFSMRPYERQPR